MNGHFKRLRLQKQFIINFVSIFMFWLSAFITNEIVSASETTDITINNNNYLDYFKQNGNAKGEIL